MSKNVVAFAIVILLVATNLALCQLRQRLLVISFDGLGQSFFNSSNLYLPWFARFRQQGVYSNNMRSIFPSETLPNHVAMATGLYAESHSVVGNHMFDPELHADFNTSNSSYLWWPSEPIWITAERQGIATSTSFWPGSNVQYPPDNMTSTFYESEYNQTVSFFARLNATMTRFERNQIQLAMIYFHQPDVNCHRFGVNSSVVEKTVQEIDWYVSILMQRLEKLPDLNVILCSDHGLADISKSIYLEDFLSFDLLMRVSSYGAVVNIQPRKDVENYVYRILYDATQYGHPFRVYRKSQLPEELHFSKNPRVMPIVIICHVGAYMKLRRPKSRSVAAHGYDPSATSMRPIFMARGPAFKSNGYQAKLTFETKEIYAMIAHVVGIKTSRSIKRSMRLIEDIFVESPEISSSTTLSCSVLLLPSALFIFTTTAQQDIF